MYNDQPAPVDMNNLYLMLCQILKFYFFAKSITLLEAHKNINYTLHSGFKRARQTVHYFCVF